MDRVLAAESLQIIAKLLENLKFPPAILVDLLPDCCFPAKQNVIFRVLRIREDPSCPWSPLSESPVERNVD